jgi:hypothetical protein
VQANLDHVGNCAAGECSGTYEHSRTERHNGRACAKAGGELGHRDVVAVE